MVVRKRIIKSFFLRHWWRTKDSTLSSGGPRDIQMINTNGQIRTLEENTSCQNHQSPRDREKGINQDNKIHLAYWFRGIKPSVI